MPNTSTISQVLPSFTAAKNGQTSTELKSNSNFNQILKNEVANKVKKPATNIAKPTTNNQATESASNQKNIAASKEAPPTEKNLSTPDKETEELADASLAISDETNNLINFVGDLGAFTLADHTNKVDDKLNASSDSLNASSINLDASSININILSDGLNVSSDGLNKSGALPPSTPIAATIALSPAPANNNATGTTLQDNSAENLALALKPATNASSTLSANSELDVKPIPIELEQKTKVDTNELANLTTERDLADSIQADSTLMAPSPKFDKAIDDVKKQLKTENKTQQDVKDAVNSSAPPTMISEQLTITSAAAELKANIASPPVANNNSLSSTTNKTTGTEEISNQLPEERRVSLNSNERSASDQFSVDLKVQGQEARQNNVEQNKESIQKLQSVETPRAESLPASPPIQAPAEANSIASSSNFIGPRVGTKAWDQAIGQKIVWMVAGGEQSAQLTLNPPDLGPVQIVLSISDSQVDASFVSSHLDVREAIEAAAPKLREMMDNAGMSLSGFSVAAQSTPSGNAFTPDGNNRNSGNNQKQGFAANAEDSTPVAAINKNQSSPKGLVDTFV
nr:flagellar hook-length control protein FliK [uncultured Undibacterium sp.]